MSPLCPSGHKPPIYSWSPPSPGTKLLGTGVAPSPGGTWGRAGSLGTQRAHGGPEGLCSPVVTSSGSTHVCVHRASCAVCTGKRVKLWTLHEALHTCVCVCVHTCALPQPARAHTCSHTALHMHTRVYTHTHTFPPQPFPPHSCSHSILTDPSPPSGRQDPPMSLSSSQAGVPRVSRMWLQGSPQAGTVLWGCYCWVSPGVGVPGRAGSG